MKKVILVITLAVLLLLTNIYQGADLNNCENLAKEYQNIHGGSMVFIQPVLSNGAYDLGRYNGHWINKVYNKDIQAIGPYYYDVNSGSIMLKEEEVKRWYSRPMEMWNIGEGEHPPFSMIRN